MQSEPVLRRTFIEQASLVPGSERVARCLQCGTCTGSCPVSYAMDLSPRMLIALFRAREMEQILKSRTIWVCASCYMCTTRCPQSIKITDLLYALKRTAMDARIYPEQFPVYVLSKAFVDLVNRYGRNQEIRLLIRYHLRRNPVELLRMLPLGWALFRRGRVALLPSKIKNLDAIRQILKAAGELDMRRPPEAPEYEPGMVGYRAVG